MKVSHERVLCFPRSLLDELGGFQGFRPDDGTLLEQILSSGQARFIERGKAEEDPSFKQLIPYVVMTWKDKLLFYVRGKKTEEGRLRSLGSVGIGGHVSVTDQTLFERDIREVFAAGLRREVTEEVEVQTEFTERVAGLINDDSNPVG
ncbi:phosphoesterase, partial [candidate division WOR-3 bacterium]|nr:phosphoesterase [candidate division WOR-3 bacterium]